MKGVRAVRGDREKSRHSMLEFRAALNSHTAARSLQNTNHKPVRHRRCVLCLGLTRCVCATASDPNVTRAVIQSEERDAKWAGEQHNKPREASFTCLIEALEAVLADSPVVHYILQVLHLYQLH